jgi:hypothetical protein
LSNTIPTWTDPGAKPGLRLRDQRLTAWAILQRKIFKKEYTFNLILYRIIQKSKVQNICGVIARTLKKKSRKERNLKFFKIMAVPVLLYGSETWTPRKRDWKRIQAAEMKYLRPVKGCTRLDQIRNEDTRNELGICVNTAA